MLAPAVTADDNRSSPTMLTMSFQETLDDLGHDQELAADQESMLAPPVTVHHNCRSPTMPTMSFQEEALDDLVHEQDSLMMLWAAEPAEPDSQDTDEERLREEQARLDRRRRRPQAVTEITSTTSCRSSRLKDVLGDAMAELSEMDPALPIEFLPSVLDVDADDTTVENSVVAVASRARRFYVGACISPVWRWLGRDTGRGRPMPGHFHKWDYMCVVGLRHGSAGPKLEERCIRYAKEWFGSTCANKANDARGCSAAYSTFVYVVCLEGLSFSPLSP